MILLCAFPFVAFSSSKDTLHIGIRVTTAERSRDSSSTTTSIEITGDKIVYNVTYGGRNRRREPVVKEFKLESADKKRLIELIKSGNLLVTKSVERTIDESGPSYSFALSLGSDVNKRKGLITINGPRNATDIKESVLYKNATALIGAVYEIIHRTDKTIVYESLIR